MKKIMMIAALAMAAVSFPSVAMAQTDATTGATQPVKTTAIEKKADCCKKACPDTAAVCADTAACCKKELTSAEELQMMKAKHEAAEKQVQEAAVKVQTAKEKNAAARKKSAEAREQVKRVQESSAVMEKELKDGQAAARAKKKK